MQFSTSNSLKGTIQQLKEIVTNIQGEDHEAARLVQQMEVLVGEIERKTARQTTTAVGPAVTAQVMA
jgi:hypothetical protein